MEQTYNGKLLVEYGLVLTQIAQETGKVADIARRVLPTVGVVVLVGTVLTTSNGCGDCEPAIGSCFGDRSII